MKISSFILLSLLGSFGLPLQGKSPTYSTWHDIVQRHKKKIVVISTVAGTVITALIIMKLRKRPAETSSAAPSGRSSPTTSVAVELDSETESIISSASTTRFPLSTNNPSLTLESAQGIATLIRTMSKLTPEQQDKVIQRVNHLLGSENSELMQM